VHMRNLVLILMAALEVTFGHEASAQCFKLRVIRNVVSVKEVALAKGKCPRNTIAKSSLRGSDGTNAPSIYGDGSAGAFSNSAVLTFSEPNPQFSTFSNSGTLTIPSGAVIRISGDFINTGTINIKTAAYPGYEDLASTSGAIVPMQQPPIAGLGRSAAGNGEFGADGTDRLGGNGGVGFQAEIARNLFFPGPYGGGGGGSCIANGAGYGGGYGGGTVVFIVGGSVNNDAGSINARGGDALTVGGGGGGGGVIIVAARESISSAGTMNVSGGNAGASDTVCAPGGGGGGGMIKLISPSIGSVGTQVVSGGAGGTGGVTSNVVISGGGGGGPGHGNGAAGSNAKDSGSTGTGSAGTSGAAYSISADPGSLLKG
jgi:hypothetical protein